MARNNTGVNRPSYNIKFLSLGFLLCFPLEVASNMVCMTVSRQNVSELSVVPLLQFRNYFVAFLEFTDVNSNEFLGFGVHQDEADIVVEEFVKIEVGNQGVIVAGVRVEFIIGVVGEKGLRASLLQVPT